MKLFYVQHDNEDGENMDVFVTAETAKDAAILWWRYYDLSDDYDADNEPAYGRECVVRPVPTMDINARAHPWDEVPVTASFQLRTINAAAREG